MKYLVPRIPHLWGLPAAPQSPVWNHMERVTDLHDGRVLMERGLGDGSNPDDSSIPHIHII